jgi:hypothetical protein
VEEKIMQRAKQKRVLEKVVIGKQNLGQEELQSILEYGAAELFADDDKAAERRITYDDAALAALLDRAKRLAEKDEHECNDADIMDAFKVCEVICDPGSCMHGWRMHHGQYSCAHGAACLEDCRKRLLQALPWKMEL